MFEEVVLLILISGICGLIVFWPHETDYQKSEQ